MRISSLPEIYKQTSKVSVKPSKQGGLYNIDLLCHSLEKQSKSYHSVNDKYNNKRSNKHFNKVQYKYLLKSSMQNNAQQLQKYGNSKGNTILINSGFPNESHRFFQNINLEEACSTRNKVIKALEETDILQQQIKEEGQDIKAIWMEFNNLQQTFNQRIQQNSIIFRTKTQELKNIISSIRRETNEQIKLNNRQSKKLEQQFYESSEIMKQLNIRNKILQQDCIEVNNNRSEQNEQIIQEYMIQDNNNNKIINRKIHTVELMRDKNKLSSNINNYHVQNIDDGLKLYDNYLMSGNTLITNKRNKQYVIK